jgi:hypothetical protein
MSGPEPKEKNPESWEMEEKKTSRGEISVNSVTDLQGKNAVILKGVDLYPEVISEVQQEFIKFKPRPQDESKVPGIGKVLRVTLARHFDLAV